jgi:hypothetical protein
VSRQIRHLFWRKRIIESFERKESVRKKAICEKKTRKCIEKTIEWETVESSCNSEFS